MPYKSMEAASRSAFDTAVLTTRIAAGGSDDVEATDLLELLDRYGAVLWEDGRHRSNVTAFITDIHMKLRARGSCSFRNACWMMRCRA